jgi:type I site-specific restriction endonuclease
MLELAGWGVQDMKAMDFAASQGVALREFPLKAGFADYMLFVERLAVGIVEAKKKGTTLSGVDTKCGAACKDSNSFCDTNSTTLEVVSRSLDI